MYLTDLPKITKLKSVLYADDCTFLCSHKNPTELNKIINSELEIIKDYFNANGLALSISKTTYMIYTPKNKKTVTMNIYIGKEMLEERKEITLLGVILDNRMNFSSHFKKVYDKMKKGLNGLSMVKNQLTYNSKLLIYYGLIESHMNYCSPIWISNISKNKLKILKTIQKKAVRIIHSAKYNAHTDSLFAKSRITKAEDIFKRESLLMTFKYQKKILPNAIMTLYENSLDTDGRFTRQYFTNMLKPNRALKKGNLMFEILTHWNNLESLKDETTIKGFKYNLTQMLNKYDHCTKQNCYSCN